MRRTSWRIVSLVLVLSLALLSCDGPSRGTNTQPSAASGFSLTITASPNVLRAETGLDGSGGCANVTVKVSDLQGRLVDGAIVTVSTSLGRFVEGTQDNLVAVSRTTLRGIATFILCPQQVTGTAIVQANVEDAFATTTVTFF
jgi:hypothetical protein